MATNQHIYQYPPNFEDCQKHYLATRIWKGLTQQTQLQECRCCQRKIGETQVGSTCCYTNTQLAFLGPGIPLFFTYLRNSILLLILLCLIFAGFGIASNVLGGTCQQATNCQTSIFNTLSIVNKATVSDFLSIQNYMCLTFVVLCVLVMHGLRFNFRRVQEECDAFVDSPSDYAIIIRRLPQDCQVRDIEEMVEGRREFLDEDQRQATDNMKVQDIILSYRLGEYTQAKQKNLAEFKKYARQGEARQFTPQPLPKPTQTATLAVVIFSRQESKDLFVYQPNIFQNIIYFFCTACLPKSDWTIKGVNVTLERAPQPDDINWENANISISGAIWRRTFYNFLAFFMLIFSGAAQYGLAVLQNNRDDNNLLQTLMGTASSVLVALMNTVFQLLIEFTSSQQRPETMTEYNKVVAVKLAVFQFLNTGIFVVFANIMADITNFSIDDTLSSEVTQIMILNAVTPSLSAFFLYYFNVVGRLKRFLTRRGWITLVQIEANRNWELHQAELPYKYAYTVRTLWLAAFYAAFVPIVVPISVIGLLFNYWVEKCLVGGSYRCPHLLSSMVNDSAVELMEYFPLILTLGEFLIYFNFYHFDFESVPDYWSIPIYLAFGISLLNIILPMKKWHKNIFKLDSDSIHYPSYREVEQNFQVTYQMTNPAYQSKRKRKQDKFLWNALFKDKDSPVQLTSLNSSRNDAALLNKPLNKQLNQSYQTNISANPLTMLASNQYKNIKPSLSTEYPQNYYAHQNLNFNDMNNNVGGHFANFLHQPNNNQF